jgi:hypothetical protein
VAKLVNAAALNPASCRFESCPAHHRKVAPIGGQPALKAGLAPQQGQGFDSFTFHHFAGNLEAVYPYMLTVQPDPTAPPFRCRVCGCDRYVVIEVRRDGKWVRTPFFKCCGCSVMFEDPLDFAGARTQAIGGNIPGSKPMIPPAPNPFTSQFKKRWHPD